MGELVGGFAGVLLLSILWEKLATRRLTSDPLYRKLLAVLAAWLTAGAIGGWGFANGGPYRWDAFVIYALPAVLVGALAIYSGLKLRRASA